MIQERSYSSAIFLERSSFQNIWKMKIYFSVCEKKAGNKNNFEDEELRHELFLTTRQTTKIKNAFASNMSKDIKFK